MVKLLKAVLLVLIVAKTIYAEELGRLFYTPPQRAALELQHEDNTLTVNGIVQKNGGKRTVWLNGVAQQPASGDAYAPESTVVLVQGKQIKVKVGQKVHVQ